MAAIAIGGLMLITRIPAAPDVEVTYAVGSELGHVASREPLADTPRGDEGRISDLYSAKSNYVMCWMLRIMTYLVAVADRAAAG